jgi:hypothetical protein
MLRLRRIRISLRRWERASESHLAPEAWAVESVTPRGEGNVRLD